MSRTFPRLYCDSVEAKGSVKFTGGIGSVVSMVGDTSARLESTNGDVFLKAGPSCLIFSASKLDMKGNNIHGLPTLPETGSSAVSKDYVDAAVQGIPVKTSVALASVASDQTMLDAATMTAGVLTSMSNVALTLDGVAAVQLSRVLIKDLKELQRAGIFVVTATGSASAPWVLTRADDANTGSEILGAYTIVSTGVTLSSTCWLMTTPLPITLDTTPLRWVLFSSTRQIIAGNGLGVNGNDFIVKPDGDTLTVQPAGVSVRMAAPFAWTGSHAFTGPVSINVANATTARETLRIATSNSGLGGADISLQAQDRLFQGCTERHLFHPMNNLDVLKLATIREIQQFVSLRGSGSPVIVARIPDAHFPLMSTTFVQFRIVGHSINPESVIFNVELMVVRRDGNFSISAPTVTAFFEDNTTYALNLVPTAAHTSAEVQLSLVLPSSLSTVNFRTHITMDLSV